MTGVMNKRRYILFRLFFILALSIVSTAAKAPEIIFSKNRSWSELILDLRKEYKKHLKLSKFEPVTTPVLRIRDDAYQLSVDLTGMDYLKLVVDGTIDGNNQDYAALGNTRFVNEEGNTIYADKIPVWKKDQDYGTLTYNKNMLGGPILIGNNPYEQGMALYADAYVIFQLDGKYNRFEAEAGVEQAGGNRNSSVVFKVVDYKTDLLFAQLESAFQSEAKLFKNYTKQSAGELFSDKGAGLIDYVARRVNSDKSIRNLVEGSANEKQRLAALGDMLQASIALEKLNRINPASTLKAHQYLVDEYGEQYLSQLEPEDEEFIDSFKSAYSEIKEMLIDGDVASIEQVDLIEEVTRRIHLSNPLISDKSIVLIRQKVAGNGRSVMANHLGYPANNWTTSASIRFPQVGWENDIVVLKDVQHPEIQSIYKPDRPVLINDPDLHWDGSRMLFSSIDQNNRWALFEVNTDGTGLHKLTPDGYQDIDFFDGCYLPNGKIAMVSTAPYQGVPCVGGNSQTGSMYLLDPTTKNIRQLNFGQDNDWNPIVLNNGRIMYLRWEYTDAAHYFTRILMSMNPDGTGKKEYYGSGSYWPNSLFEARPVPGNTSMFSGIVSGHHGVARSGRLLLFDAKNGRHEADGVVQEIPYRNRKVEPIIKDKLVNGVWPQFLSAYPLDEKFYLANAKLHADALWGLYLVDVYNNMTLIYENENQALMYPMVLEQREKPPVIPERVNLKDSTSTVYIANIYEGPGLKDVPKGSVDSLRLFAYHFTYNKAGGHDALGIQTGWDVKRVLGTVAVEKDGSAIFEIPANVPISLQPLDENGRAMQLMRSWFTGMPGEVVSCVGCHEDQNTLPPVRPTIASRKQPDKISPFYGETRPFTFMNEIQPLLDRKCVSCHDGNNRLPDFSNASESGYRKLSGSYRALHSYVRRPGPESDLHVLTPMDYHASTSELIQKLEEGHHNVKLTREEWDRLHTWIDLNVPYHGNFESKEYCNYDQKERRQELAIAFGGKPIDIDKELEIAAYLSSLQNREPIKPERSIKKEKVEKSTQWSFGKDEARIRQHSLGEFQRTIELEDGVTLNLVKVPAGEYHNDNNDKISIHEAFWISEFEITNQVFKQIFPEHDSRHVAQFWKDHTTQGYPVNEPNQPVVRVSWQEVKVFCEELSEATGLKFSLPSGAQWEWACRAGSITKMWFGGAKDDFSKFENLADESLSDFAVIGVDPKPMRKDDPRFEYYNFIPQAPFNDGEMISSTVGKYMPNPWGLYDMHGNVSEWVLDDYKPTSAHEEIKTGEKKTVKGGSWRDRPQRSTAASKIGYYPWQKVENVGFRVIMVE